VAGETNELVSQPPHRPEDRRAVRAAVVEEMMGAMTLDVPLDVSVHEGATWAECEK